MYKLLLIGTISIFIHANCFSFSFESNESKQKKWAEVLDKNNDFGRACLKIGIQKKKIKTFSTDPNAEITSISDPDAKEIFSTCDNLLKMELRTNINCKTKEGEKAICEDRFCYERDGKKFNSKDTGAFNAAFDGINVSTCMYETNESKTSRTKPQDESKEKEPNSNSLISAEEEKHKKYIASPEYKKQQAEIEKQRIIEEKRVQIESKKEQTEIANRINKCKNIKNTVAGENDLYTLYIQHTNNGDCVSKTNQGTLTLTLNAKMKRSNATEFLTAEVNCQKKEWRVYPAIELSSKPNFQKANAENVVFNFACKFY